MGCGLNGRQQVQIAQACYLPTINETTKMGTKVTLEAVITLNAIIINSELSLNVSSNGQLFLTFWGLILLVIVNKLTQAPTKDNE